MDFLPYKEECTLANHESREVRVEVSTSDGVRMKRYYQCITCSLCCQCGAEAITRVASHAYCSSHRDEAEERCRKIDPTDEDELYALVVVPREMKWVRVGRRTSREEAVRRLPSKSSQAYTIAKAEARAKARAQAHAEVMRRKEELILAARALKAAKAYFEAHPLPEEEDSLKYSV